MKYIDQRSPLIQSEDPLYLHGAQVCKKRFLEKIRCIAAIHGQALLVPRRHPYLSRRQFVITDFSHLTSTRTKVCFS
jgi:hypothetical protein